MTETTKMKIEMWLTFDELELIHKCLKETLTEVIEIKSPRKLKRENMIDIHTAINGSGLFDEPTQSI